VKPWGLKDILELSALAGVSVWEDFTVAEMFILAKARGEYVQREAWQHTSTLVATIANLFREKGKAAFQPSDFNPV